ncbi:MAG TPA: isochorismatase family cysteine hydrolase [Pyrinomonadaceae bacterium]|nr:isochorismatase family cysteine hydrolase [Pyrinomonadaceae bacterium]
MPLIIIDMLNDFFRQHAHLAEQRARLVASINALVEAFRHRGQPVLWVRQEFAPDLHDAFLEMRKHNLRVTIAGTDGCELLPELDHRPTDITIVKKRYSAFFGTDLEATLQRERPDMLVVAGINTHACIRTTVIDAYQRDYEVVVAAECIASNDEAHHDITTRYLGGAIAQLLSNSEIIKMLES